MVKSNSTKSNWLANRERLIKQNQKTRCGKLGGKYPTRKSCPKECEFIDQGSGDTMCKPKSTRKHTRNYRKSHKHTRKSRKHTRQSRK